MIIVSLVIKRTRLAKTPLPEIEASVRIGVYAIRRKIKDNPNSKILIMSFDPEFSFFYPELSSIGFKVLFATCCENPEKIKEFGASLVKTNVWLWSTMCLGGPPMDMEPPK